VTVGKNASKPAEEETAGGPGTGASAMFDRFTDRARRVVVLASEAAHQRGHDYIGPEHILLGLIDEGEGLAVKALELLGISLPSVRSQVEETIGEGHQAPPDRIPFSPRAKKALELSLRETVDLGHAYIGTEHILLGLIREVEGVAARVLFHHGADLGLVRQQVIQLLHDLDEGEDDPTAAPDVLDPEARNLLEAAVKEAQEAGDRTLGGQHLLLAMCLGKDTSWLALQWAGASARTLIAAALKVTGGGSPHHDHVPVSQELQVALESGWRAAGQQPLSRSALLTALMRSGEPSAVQTVVDAGLHPQDVLDAVAALSRFGEVDAIAGQLARAGSAVGSRPPVVADEQPEQPASVAQPAASGWTGPDREAAMSMRQFQLAVVSALYLPLVVVTLGAVVAAAIGGRGLWLLVLAPLVAVGNPTLGTWTLLPVAGLFWWLHVPIVAALMVAGAPLDAFMGALMQLRNDVDDHPPEHPDDLRIRTRHVMGSLLGGAEWRASDGPARS
jgi:hypothetical protein